MKWIKYIGSTVLVLYVLLCTVMYFAQEKAVFNPYPLSESQSFGVGEEVEIPLEEGLSMNCLMIRTPEPTSKGVILYLHGNRGNIGFGIYQSRHMKGRGYDVFIPDYRSYGKTEGSMQSESQVLLDVKIVYEYLKKQYEESKICVIGYSLGTGMASYLASEYEPKHLVLIAPFTSLVDIKNQFFWFIPDFLMKYQLRSEEFLKEVKCPITLVHGTNDRVVAYKYSQALAKIKPAQTRLFTVEGENHRGIIFDPVLRDALDEILK